MKPTTFLIISVLLLYFVGPGVALGRTTPMEKIVRETYRKLETYNAAAQIFKSEYAREPIRAAANLSFELTGFRAGAVTEILNQRYADLVTMPTGEIVSLTRAGHSLDGGPQEATYGAEW